MTKTQDDSSVQALKTATAPTLSGRSRLTYQVGRNGDSDLCIRLTGNTATGAFCQDWIRLPAILKLLEKAPRHTPITSDVLMTLLSQGSANQPGFLWAVLLNEGIVKRREGTRRYEFSQPAEVEAVVKALAEGQGGTPGTKAKGKAAKGKSGTPVRKASASTKKK